MIGLNPESDETLTLNMNDKTSISLSSPMTRKSEKLTPFKLSQEDFQTGDGV